MFKNFSLMKNYPLIFILFFTLTACTYSITMVHTEGQASDVVDETATNTPSTSISPTVAIPASVI